MFGTSKTLVAVTAAGVVLGFSSAFASAGVVPYGNVTVTTTSTLSVDSQPIAALSDGVKEDTSAVGATWSNAAVHISSAPLNVTFDLGQAYTLSQINVSYATAVNFGVPKNGSVEVYFSSTSTFGAIADITFDSQNASSWTESANGWATALDAPIPLATPHTAQYVKMVFNVGAYSGLGSPWDAGTSEVQFETTPEPASLALLGLGGLAMLRRRRAAMRA